MIIRLIFSIVFFSVSIFAADYSGFGPEKKRIDLLLASANDLLTLCKAFPVVDGIKASDTFIDNLLLALSNEQRNNYPSIKIDENCKVSLFVDKSGFEDLLTFASGNRFKSTLYNYNLNAELELDKIVEVFEHQFCWEIKINLAVEELDEALKEHYNKYQNYRGGQSLLSLITRDLQETNTIRLFPVASLDDNYFAIRAAGCQISEIMSIQVQRFLPDFIEKKYSHIHWEIPGVKQYFGIDKTVAEDVLNKIIEKNEMWPAEEDGNKPYLHLQSDGFDIFCMPQSKHPTVKIIPMSEEVKLFYARYTQSSLTNLAYYVSLDIGKKDFFQYLIEVLEDKIIYEEKHPWSDSPQKIAALVKCIENIRILLSNDS